MSLSHWLYVNGTPATEWSLLSRCRNGGGDIIISLFLVLLFDHGMSHCEKPLRSPADQAMISGSWSQQWECGEIASMDLFSGFVGILLHVWLDLYRFPMRWWGVTFFHATELQSPMMGNRTGGGEGREVAFSVGKLIKLWRLAKAAATMIAAVAAAIAWRIFFFFIIKLLGEVRYRVLG